MKCNLSVLSVGGFDLPSSDTPIEILQGSHYVLRAQFKTNAEAPINIQYHDAQIKIHNMDDTILEVTGVAYDNVNGMTDFTLQSSYTSKLKLSTTKKNISAVLVLTLKSNQAVKCYVILKGIFLVKEASIP